jgi:hydantoinase/carbamoylase family amidase
MERISRPQGMQVSVDPERIRTNLAAFARIGYGGDGMQRLAYSRADLRARQLLTHLMQTLELDVRVDAIGNIFGRRPGSGPDDVPAILVGSHLDAVPGGGRFDGSTGVVAALEVIAALRDAGYTTRHPIEVVSFACEESSRFGKGTIGSGVVAGAYPPAEILGLRDVNGVTLSQALQRLGMDPTTVSSARLAPGSYAAYLELHIEQGRVLEQDASPIGIVEGIAAPTRFWLRLTGRADHSGATPMSLRADALTGAAEIILAVERRASEIQNVVGTVGVVRLQPGVMNVVPGWVELGVDVRAAVSEDKRRLVTQVQADIEYIARVRGLSFEIEMIADEEPVTLHDELINLLEQCCGQRGYRSLRMVSGAGHDAMHMAGICPAGMVLVPSRHGISHAAAEWTDLDDLTHGVQILVDATLALAHMHQAATWLDDIESR